MPPEPGPQPPGPAFPRTGTRAAAGAAYADQVLSGGAASPGEPRAAAEEMRPFREEHLTRSARAGTPPESWARDAATYATQPHRRAAAPTRRPWTRARRGRSTQAR
ncbi:MULTISPECIES: hypothetical protein [Streptomyces]|uniref:hypothetical protein n=1 Tax=Streptomyces TaxID=1883 RepID=UPI001D04BEB5|nr:MULTISPECIES: hypothetical protein [Streptomyces]MCR0990883.1 hypothetical protein [Streptomyces albidoflavus]UDF10519.1 hypothetical protein LH646_24735 [Streptomyces sp. WA1-19]